MRRLLPGVFGLALLCCGVAVAQEKAPIVLGLHADMSSGSAMAGEAIRRGALLAISEINAQGGLLGGRTLELVVRDHHGVPTRATEQLPELASTPHLVAILSGLHSPPVTQNLRFIHEHQLIIVSPWAAATGMVHHELTPNYTFRVSMDDARVGDYLVAQALARGHERLGVMLEKTAWGRSNEKAITEALARRGMAPVSVQWFNWADTDMETQLAAVERAGAEALLMVANAPEGAAIAPPLCALGHHRRRLRAPGGRGPLRGGAARGADLLLHREPQRTGEGRRREVPRAVRHPLRGGHLQRGGDGPGP
jgi:branched-chain amino acid transport system substrate-binding protein